MKPGWMVTAVLVLVSTATGFAQTPAPSVAPLSAAALAAILAEPLDPACPAPQGDVVLAAQRSLLKTCSATATCNDTSGVNVSCTYTGSGGTCTFTNQSCANGVRGQVNCNGTVKQCPQCPCGTPHCCICEETGDCFSCCRCAGGTFAACSLACGPP
jgi:hypothetical protein